MSKLIAAFILVLGVGGFMFTMLILATNAGALVALFVLVVFVLFVLTVNWAFRTLFGSP